MTKWRKIPPALRSLGKGGLGLVCLLVGGALVLFFGAAIFESLSHKGGLSLLNLAGCIGGLFGIGGACDLLGPPRKPEAAKTAIAESRFASRADIVAAGLAGQGDDDGGIYLGVFKDAEGELPLRWSGETHLLTYGKPGAHKTCGYIIPNLAMRDGSTIAFDPKRQLFSITGRQRARMGKVILVDPFGPHSDGWNPLSQLNENEDDFEDGASCIADAITDKSTGGEGNARFFDSSSETLATTLIMWERFKNGDKASLSNLRAMVSAPDGSFLTALGEMGRCNNAAIRNVAGRLAQRLTDTNAHSTSAQDVIDTFMSNTRFLDNPALARDMAKGGAIDFGALHREVVSIFVILPVEQLEKQAKYLRMFLNLSLHELYKNPRPLDPPLPRILYILDEASNLGALKQIPRALTIARDFGIQLWAFYHYVAQIKKHYPQDWEGFLVGSGVKTTFKTGDADTPDLLVKLFGQKEELIPTLNPQGGISNTPNAIPLIRAEDIGRLLKGEAISIIEPCPMPIKTFVPVYVDTPYAAGLDANPFYRAPRKT
jgi:type IV secretory pathway TraG/TraD family ATPase VirD4